MADRSIIVRLRAQVDGFKSEMAAAAKAAESTGKATEQAAQRADTAMGRMVQSATQHRAAWDTAGTALTGFGAATLGALGLATKAAMDWESSWAGVTKTTDGSTAQMAALEQQLRGLATTLPSSHQEIAAVAEAAGQLGVQRDSIAAFTRTMIDLGETTNLTADEAATAIAQFSNVMGTSADDVDNLGAALVALGNDGASTEADIMNMSQRLSGAGALIGASEQDIMGLSSALSSVGISAEMGGGALSRVLQDMNTAVLEGGDSLDLFAQTAGMSASEFSAAWRADPIVALDAFTQGLNGVTENGGNAIGVLSDLGIKSTEETRALMSLAGAGSLLSDSLATANSGWADGTALIVEATKRYETAESRIQIARNQLIDFGIDVGGVVLPALADLAEKAGDLASWFADLPAPVQQGAVALAGIAGAASLGAGGFLLIVPRVLETVAAFKQLSTTADGSVSSFGKIGKALGALALVGGAVAGITALGDSMKDFTMGAEEAAVAATRLAESANPMADVFSGMITAEDLGSVQDMASGLDVLANGRWWTTLQDAGTNVLNVFGAGGATIDEQRERLEQFGQTIASMAQTDLPGAQAAFKAMFDQLGGTDEVGRNLLESMPALRDELIGVANAAGLATDDATLLKIATGEITPAAAGAEDALTGAAGAMGEVEGAADDALGAVRELADEFLKSRSAAREWEAALDDANGAIAENGRTLDIGTEKGRANAEALDRLAQAALDNAAAMDASDRPDFLSGAREQIIQTADDMGMSRTEAEAYVDQLGMTPESIRTQVDLNIEASQAKIDAYVEKFGEVPPSVMTEAGIDAELAKTDLNLLNHGLDDFASKDAIASVDVDTAEGQAALTDLENSIEWSDATLTINGDPANARTILETLKTEISTSNGTVTINGQSVPAEQALATTINQIDNGAGTITIKGNKGPADQATDQAVGKANRSHGTIDVSAATGLANAAIDRAARDRTARINVVATGAVGFANAVLGRAAGGPVYGPGTGTSDSIPAVLSNGEHVLTAREVEMAGGQAAIFRMREGIRMGALRFADGGGLERGAPVRMAPAPWVDPRITAALSNRPAASAARGLQVTQQINGADPVAVARESVSLIRHEARAMAVNLPGG